jgi:tetratricopeptide (TPR) repeat protein
VAVLSAPPESGRVRVADAFGIAGTGKSWLIDRVKNIWRSRGEAVVFELELPATAPTTLSQTYTAFVDRVSSLGEELARTVGRERTMGHFDNELRKISRGAIIDIEQRIHAEEVTIGDHAEVAGTHVEVGSDALENMFYGSRAWVVTSLFVKLFGPKLKRKTLVVSLGEYDAVAGSLLAHWLLRLLASLPNTLVLVERSPGTAKLPVASEEHVVPLFTHDEVGALLASCLEAEPDPALVDTVYEWSEGHPATAALAGRFLRTFDSATAENFVERLRELPGELAEERARIAIELCGVGKPPLLRTAAIPRRFDEDLLMALLDDPPEDAMNRLLDTQVVQTVGNPDKGKFRVQGYVREPLLKLLSQPERKQLHRKAADYYYDLLCSEEAELDEDAPSYHAWYRYEKPEWQESMREWLYHLGEGAKTDGERQRARLQFTRIFLDAFWWWGCYIDFPYCHDLLADWDRARSDDADWTQDMRQLLDAYPIGWRKAGEGNWPDVRAALVELKDSCGIAGEAARLKDDARHTRGLVDNFTAHFSRYREHADDAARDRHYGRAIGYYREAAELFAEESWELAWTLFETAELHSDFGQLDAAREVWRQAVAAALDEDDPELIANLHRLRADIRWKAKEDAFDSHGRALLHAYFFQCRTPANRPDVYTLAFYLEHVERVHERLKTLTGAKLADAIARVQAPFAFEGAATEWSGALPVDYRELAGTILPAAPRAEELLATRSDLTRRIDGLAEELGPVDRDLEGVDP